MEQENDKRAGSGHEAYDIVYFIKKFGISETEVKMALAEIHYGSAGELEDYLKVKYRG
jgi:hypothetical protein